MATECFLKIDGIEGDSTDEGFQDAIKVLSWSWGASQSGSSHTGRGAAGKVQLQDLSFAHRPSKASPQLFLACATGRHIKEAVLTCREAGGEQEAYLALKFSDVLVTSFRSGSSSAAELPMDQVSLSFTVIEIEVRPMRPDGTFDPPIDVGWDIKLSREV